MLKLHDLECRFCGRLFPDVFVDTSSLLQPHPPAEDNTGLCPKMPKEFTEAGLEGPCFFFKIVIAVPRNSKHTSWQVR